MWHDIRAAGLDCRAVFRDGELTADLDGSYPDDGVKFELKNVPVHDAPLVAIQIVANQLDRLKYMGRDYSCEACRGRLWIDLVLERALAIIESQRLRAIVKEQAERVADEAFGLRATIKAGSDV